MYRTFRLIGTPYILPPGTPKAQVQILREAMRKAYQDPEFHKEFPKLSGFEASPIMPEEMEKAIRELPRDRETGRAIQKALRLRSITSSLRRGTPWPPCWTESSQRVLVPLVFKNSFGGPG